MPRRRQTLNKRPLYGGAILALMAVTVASLLHVSRDRIGAHGREDHWRPFSDRHGVCTLDLPASWHREEIAEGGKGTQMIAVRSPDTLVTVLCAPFDGQPPARATRSQWQSLLSRVHEECQLLKVVQQQLCGRLAGYSETEVKYTQRPGAFYCGTGTAFHVHRGFREIPKWGRRVSMVTRRGYCVVECVTREARKAQMEPMFDRLLKSLRPTEAGAGRAVGQ